MSTVVAGTALVLMLRPFEHRPVVSKRPYPASGRFAIFAGMTQAEVLRKTGPPTTRRGNCWQYNANRPIEYRTPKGIRNGVLTAVRICFFARAVYDVRYQIDGKWPAPEPTRV